MPDEIDFVDWVGNPDPNRLDFVPIEEKPEVKTKKPRAKPPRNRTEKQLKAAQTQKENAMKLQAVLSLPPELNGAGRVLMGHARAAGARVAAKEIFSKALGKVDGIVDDEDIPMDTLLKILDISGKYGLGTKIEVNFGQHELLAVFSRVAHKHIPDPVAYEAFAHECFAAIKDAGFDKAMGGDGAIEAHFEDVS